MRDSQKITYDLIIGKDNIITYLDVLVEFKSNFYMEYPYLQDTSDINYQTGIVRNILLKPGCVLILAKDGDEVVGAAVSIPLTELDSDMTKFKKFAYQNNINIEDLAYGVWTMTRPEYRRSGINSTLGDMFNTLYEKEGKVGRLMINVVRPSNDPKSPKGFTKASEFFLSKRGYVKVDIVPELTEWVDIGDTAPSRKSFEYYIKWL